MLRRLIIKAFSNKMVLPKAGPGSDLETQLFLPDALSGVGISDPVATLPAAYYASLATVVCDITVTVLSSSSAGVQLTGRNLWSDIIGAARAPQDPQSPFTPIGVSLQRSIDALSRDGSAEFANLAGGLVAKSLEEFGTLFVPAAPAAKVQSIITVAMGLMKFRALLERHAGTSDADKAAYIRIACSAHPGAARWLRALPTTAESGRLLCVCVCVCVSVYQSKRQ